jgi:glyoxylase-like metal-dependent hydrolase (beta-lactamase superfamily II)
MELIPGIKAIAAPGHAPRHMALAVSSEGEQLLNLVDTVLHPIHIERPEWCAVVDFMPYQVVATRHRLLEKAATEQALVLAFHFPFPGLGHIVMKREGWQWKPIEVES